MILIMILYKLILILQSIKIFTCCLNVGWMGIPIRLIWRPSIRSGKLSKVREKSGNFEMNIEWPPWPEKVVTIIILGQQKSVR